MREDELVLLGGADHVEEDVDGVPVDADQAVEHDDLAGCASSHRTARPKTGGCR